MEVHVDTHFVIGGGHLVNEDYAAAGLSPTPWMVLADGCSASPDTDIGARLLVAAAREYLTAQRESTAAELAVHSAFRAEAAARVLGLPPSVLDATLVAAFIQGDSVNVILLGDGAVCYTDRAGTLHLIEVEYSHNAPYYPAYRLDKDKDDTYRRRSAAGGAVKTVRTDGRTRIEPLFEPTVLRLPVANLESLLIASDGIGSFRHKASGKSLSAEDVARRLTDFRGVAGGFVKRKLKRALKQWAGEGVVHDDDLSIGAMVFQREGAAWTSTTAAADGSV